MLPTKNLGIVSPVSMGAWSANTVYQALNIVSTPNGFYLAYSANVNIQPEVTPGWRSAWMVLSRKLVLTEEEKTEIINSVLSS